MRLPQSTPSVNAELPMLSRLKELGPNKATAAATPAAVPMATAGNKYERLGACAAFPFWGDFESPED
jgi:hypothetical protein